jgi:PIN domain nuclease of toxin-antitoxin system
MILLDTCALLFDVLQSRPLSAAARVAVDAADTSGQLHILDVTLAEIAWLVRGGRLQVDGELKVFLDNSLSRRAVRVLPVTTAIAATAAGLDMHKDPADRLIAAATLVHSAQLVTADELLRDLVWLPTIW